MGGEVHEGYVDTSLAAYVNSMERSEVLDFTQGIFQASFIIAIKRPLKTDVSLRYFWLGNFFWYKHDIMRYNYNKIFLYMYRIHQNFMDGFAASDDSNSTYSNSSYVHTGIFWR